MSKIGQLKIEMDEELAEKLSNAESTINSEPVKKEEKKIKETITEAPNPEKTEWAIFKDYVESAELVIKKKDGTTYLKAEGWLYLAMLKGLVPSVETEAYRDMEGGLAVKATCKLFDKETGRLISQSDMYADKSEDFLENLPDYAVYGMAETRAISRAVRNVYGYILKGIGYESTPAIEMGLEKDVAD